jgi:hypothetical protein
MSTKTLILSFLKSRGGLIVLSALVAILTRTQLWVFGSRDLIIAASIIAAWPLLEYSAHRWFLHEWTWTPFRKSHDRHHEHPSTDTGLPEPWVIAVYFLNSVIFAFTLPGLYTAHCSVLAMLSIYEFIHFSCHCNYTPKTWWGWSVRINHLTHHNLDRPSRYAMSLPIVRVRDNKPQGQ